jgi:hypothetical protein
MLKAVDDVSEVPPLPKGDASGVKTTHIDRASRDSHIEQLSSSSSNSSSKEKLTNTRESSKIPKARN